VHFNEAALLNIRVEKHELHGARFEYIKAAELWSRVEHTSGLMSGRPASLDDDEYASARSGSVNALKWYHDEPAFEPEMTRESKRLASDARLWQASMGDSTRQLRLYLDNYGQVESFGYDALKILALLESGADPAAYRGRNKDTILHSISEWSSPTGTSLMGILDKIVFRCRNLINIANEYEMLPIFRVCASSSRYPDNTDRIAILKILIKYGAKIDVLDNLGISPLGIAIFGVNKDMFDFWLANGADPNYGGYGNRPIEGAVIKRNAYMVSRLLKLNVDLNFTTEREGRQMLQVGINHPDRDIQMCFVNWRFNAARGQGVHDDFRRLGLKSGRIGGH